MNSIFCPQENTEEALLLLLISESMVGKREWICMCCMCMCIFPFLFLNENRTFFLCLAFWPVFHFLLGKQAVTSETQASLLRQQDEFSNVTNRSSAFGVAEPSLIQTIGRWTQSQVFDLASLIGMNHCYTSECHSDRQTQNVSYFCCKK